MRPMLLLGCCVGPVGRALEQRYKTLKRGDPTVRVLFLVGMAASGRAGRVRWRARLLEPMASNAEPVSFFWCP